MVVYCRVKICKHKSKDKCTLHRFPKNNNNLCKEWVRLTGNEDLLHKHLEDLNNERICSCHFTSEDYTPGKKLKLGSVPTIFFENTPPIDDEKVEKFFLTSNRLATTASVKPLVDISNPKAITHKQPQMIRIVQNVNEIEQPSGHIEQFTTVENREFTVCPMLEDVNQTSQRIIHHKRKVSESGSGTSEESTDTSVSNKRYRTSAFLNGKPIKFENLCEQPDDNSNLSYVKSGKIVDFESESLQNLTQHDEYVEVTNITKIVNKFEQLCKSLEPTQLKGLSYKIDLLANYYWQKN
ncbi:uncharacterized protein LOC123275180 [Cotesia glomerata]|uniref:THAP-type domain-containing protein n=1 Tax=Cotesia glomerata TaxID=32391 RepID=A0AAV7IT99_COTGL|nr:uncharacterized protein LOC123275180 [Cotesia glomerata]KAH0568008.1 hypothetical protein KQX54_017365 [Cotesia glomerata]